MKLRDTRLAVSGFVFALLWVCMSGVPLHAQTVGGTILGLVQDQQGGGVPKAEVSARSFDTGAIRKSVSTDNGEYRITGVPAGAYELSATAAGFKTEVRSGIVVTVGADVAVNLALTVGAISEKVEVTGEAAQVDTSTSAMGGFVNSTTIRELPLNGRDWLQLALLQPGANFNTGQTQTDSGRAQKGNGIAISISGGRPSDNAFRIDGLVVNDYANAGPGSSLHVNMGVDAIREFSVLTNNYSAEYGRGSGGIINAITKSGTNQVHGSAYYFHRNSALDARNFFDLATIPAFHRHQYGGAIGGPIKKDKTFFFANYETLTELKGLSNNFDTISNNARNGLICTNAACTSTTQVTVPASIKPYLALYPFPNGALNGDTGKFAFGNPRIGDEKYVIGKVDHYFTSATTLSGSYSYDDTKLTVLDDFALKTIASPSRRINGVINLQHVFSPTLISTTRVGVSRTFAYNNQDSNPRNPALTDPSLGFIPGVNLGVLTIGNLGKFVGIGGGFGTSGLNLFGNTDPQLSQDFSWTKGRHSIRVGLSVERFIYNLTSSNRSNGEFTFNSVSNLVQGKPDTFIIDFPGTDTVRGERMTLYGGYFQDDFRVLPNLTLNLGVRYEMGTVIKEVNGKLANLRNITDKDVATGDPYYLNPTTKNFAPRLGFAWDPFKNGKTAIRGGVAMFDIVALPYQFVLRTPRSAPFYLSPTLSPVPAGAFPNKVLPFLTNDTLKAIHVEFDPDRTYKGQWNLNIQRQLTRSMALTVGYVGTVGVHLDHAQNDIDQVPDTLVRFDQALDAFVFPIPAAGKPIQRINPNWGSFSSTEWNGHSSYHSLQTNLVQRPIKGLTYQLAYTFSKSIDDGSAVGNEASESSNTSGAGWAFCRSCNRGVSDFDIPHNFVANFQYDVPMFAAVKQNAIGNTILGGWQVGGIYTRQTGGAFSIKDSGDRAFTGSTVANTGSGGQRPMYVNAPGCSPNAVTGDIGRYVKTECFAFPAPGVLGNLGRNTLRMPVFRNLDFSVFKNQNLWGEKLKAQFRVEMFNVLNNTNLQATLLTMFNGSGVIGGTFGKPSSVVGTVNTSRQIQLGLRLLF
jgi:hypothetical protein